VPSLLNDFIGWLATKPTRPSMRISGIGIKRLGLEKRLRRRLRSPPALVFLEGVPKFLSRELARGGFAGRPARDEEPRVVDRAAGGLAVQRRAHAAVPAAGPRGAPEPSEGEAP